MGQIRQLVVFIDQLRGRHRALRRADIHPALALDPGDELSVRDLDLDGEEIAADVKDGSLYARAYLPGHGLHLARERNVYIGVIESDVGRRSAGWRRTLRPARRQVDEIAHHAASPPGSLVEQRICRSWYSRKSRRV